MITKLFEQDAKELGGGHVELWILEVDGKKRLPAFSSQKKFDCLEMISGGITHQAPHAGGTNRANRLSFRESLIRLWDSEIQ